MRTPKTVFLIIFLCLIGEIAFSQVQIVLNKGQKHFLDSLHTIYTPYLASNRVDYQPIMLRDSAHWILPTNILSDTSFSAVYHDIIGAGYGPSIIIRTVQDSEYVKPKIFR